MTFTKKEWVNVPNASSLTKEELNALIPKGQDDLARFDKENMNRIEEGIQEAIDISQNHINDSSLHNKSTDGGGAVGSGASASTGGAVGSGATATLGGAVGRYATTGGGFAGGDSAKTIKEDGELIDAIQLGTGTNNTPKTLKVYDYQLMKADGTIPDERMPGKAPSGHGLGTDTPTSSDKYLDAMKSGCGFLQIKNKYDSPDGSSNWTSVIQAVRSTTPENLTGAQLAFRDSSVDYPTMWMRTVASNEPQPWVEMIHSGNYEKYGNSKIFCGTYKGSGVSNSGNQKTVTVDFAPKIIIIESPPKTGNTKIYRAILTNIYGSTYGWVEYSDDSQLVSRMLHVNWSSDGKTVSWYAHDKNAAHGLSEQDVDYRYIAIG